MNKISCESKLTQRQVGKAERLKTGLKIGFFWVVGFVGAGYISTEEAQFNLLGKTYTVYADFQSVDGLRNGALIEISGVRVGSVERIFLTNEDMARVEMRIKQDISLPDDTIISIKSRGLLGGKIISISRGGSDEYVAAGGVLLETVSGLDLESLIGKFVFGKV